VEGVVVVVRGGVVVVIGVSTSLDHAIDTRVYFLDCI
jgi:hypothetical protein